MVQISAGSAILQHLAREHRRVLSGWRAFILLRRATFERAARERRWSNLPKSERDVYPTLRAMERRGELQAVPHLPYIYQVTVPYADMTPLSEYEILMEVHPYAALGYLSALAFHDLTLEQPKEFVAIVPRIATGDQLPIGTEPRDWEGIRLVQGRMSPAIMDRSVNWIRLTPERYFGIREYQPQGYPVQVTTPERTLLDGLQRPDLSGGLENVLEAWAMAADILNLDFLIASVERFDIGVLRQRVGFLLEELEVSHPVLDSWQANAKRGGSSKLLASAPYADTYSERWNLSINAPVSALRNDPR